MPKWAFGFLRTYGKKSPVSFAVVVENNRYERLGICDKAAKGTEHHFQVIKPLDFFLLAANQDLQKGYS